MSEEEDIVGQILESGKHDPAAVVEAQRKAAIKSLEVARNVNATFTSPAGAATLQWLRGVTIEQSSFTPGVAGGSAFSGLDSAYQGFVREGQNSIYRELVRLMKYAQDPPAEVLALVEGDSK